MESKRVRYERELHDLDRMLGLLFDQLRERDLMNNAVIIIAADHGEGMFDHVSSRLPKRLGALRPGRFFQMEHGENVFQELVDTPLIFWGRGIPAGHVVEDPVENLDIFPTLVEMCGLSPPGALHGHSLMPHLRGEEAKLHESVFAFIHTNVMVREVSTNMKLIAPTLAGVRRGATPALYNLSTDPQERINLYESDQESLQRLAAQLQQWEAAYPTRSTDAGLKDATTFADLRDLGYLGGEDED